MNNIAQHNAAAPAVHAVWAGARRADARALYGWLMANARSIGEFDSHIFACILAARAAEPTGSLCNELGLDKDNLTLLIAHYFPGTIQTGDKSMRLKCQMRMACGVEEDDARNTGCDNSDGAPDSEHAAEAICGLPGSMGPGMDMGQASWVQDVMEEEIEDLRDLLLEHRSLGLIEEEWLASIIATACQGNGHLWEDLGVTCRDDLSLLLQRHFFRLFNKNSDNMKWKKFFYKQLCDREGVDLCKAPNCRDCDEYDLCFGPE